MFRTSFLGIEEDEVDASKSETSVVLEARAASDDDNHRTDEAECDDAANNTKVNIPFQKLSIPRMQLDILLKMYERWLDANPLKARSMCVP